VLTVRAAIAPPPRDRGGPEPRLTPRHPARTERWAVQRAQDVLFAFARQDLDERPSRRLPVTRLIADALAPNHPFAEAIGVASNYHAAIIVVILLDDAATATFISIIVASIIVDPWTSRTNFDSDLSVSGRPGGGRDQAQ
jgi:hypothetical protein